MVRVTRLQQQVPPSEKPKNVLQPKYPDEEYLIVGDTKIAAWGNNNDFPSMADQVISSVGVLNTGLKFTRNFTLGQSIFACTVTDFDESGNEVLSQVKDKSLITFANSRRTSRELAKVINDLSFTWERTSLPDSSKSVTVQAKILCPSVKLRVNFKPVFKTPTLLITWSAIDGKSLLFPQAAILVSPTIRYSSSGYLGCNTFFGFSEGGTCCCSLVTLTISDQRDAGVVE